MHKYYWEQQQTADAESSAPEAPAADDAEVQQQREQLPAEILRHDVTYPATGSGSGSASLPPPPLIPYGLPVVRGGGGGGDPCGGAKLLPTAAVEYYETSSVAGAPAGYHLPTHGGADYVNYAGYSPASAAAHDVSMMVGGAGNTAAYHHRTGGYQCQRMASSTGSPAQFAADVKSHSGPVLPHHGNSTAELYQWVREQQNFAAAAANAIGNKAHKHHS